MKRDMELVRQILLKLEQNCNVASFYELNPNEFQASREELLGHSQLLLDRKLATGQIVGGRVLFQGLTWEGHDFLDNSRDSTVWEATMKAAGGFSFGIFVKVLVETATRYALSKIPTF